MRRIPSTPARSLAGAISLALAFTLAAAAAGRDRAADDDDAKALAVKLLTAGAAKFDAKDAPGLAATYTDDAVLTSVSRESGGTLKTEVYRGKADIEKVYNDHFKGDASFHARNNVDYARHAGPDILIVGGVFEPDAQAADPIKIPFVQVRVKQGDAWKIANIQIFILTGK